MQKHNPYTLPTLDQTEQERRIILSLESIVDRTEDAQIDTLGIIAHATILNEAIDTEELTTALMNAREALKTAHNIAENLRTARHQDER